MKLQTVMCYRVGRNYHLCGNQVKTSCMNLNNVWEKYSPEIYIQGKKRAKCMCTARAKGCYRGRIFLLSETTVGVEMFLLYKKAPVDLLFVVMQEKLSRSRQTYRFMSEEAN